MRLGTLVILKHAALHAQCDGISLLRTSSTLHTRQHACCTRNPTHHPAPSPLSPYSHKGRPQRPSLSRRASPMAAISATEPCSWPSTTRRYSLQDLRITSSAPLTCCFKTLSPAYQHKQTNAAMRRHGRPPFARRPPFGRYVATHFNPDADLHGHRPAVSMPATLIAPALAP